MRPLRASEEEIALWLSTHPHWRRREDRIVLEYAGPYDACVDLLVATRDAVRRLDHHPVCRLTYDTLSVELWTHDRGGVTVLDFELAEVIDITAGQLCLRPVL